MVIYDVNQNQPIRIINDTHFKHIHTVKFYEGIYSQGDPEALNTFLTASQDSTIKLWDLRVGGSQNPVREYSGGHQNRSM